MNAEEVETVILLNKGEDAAIVTTNDPILLKRLARLGAKPSPHLGTGDGDHKQFRFLPDLAGRQALAEAIDSWTASQRRIALKNAKNAPRPLDDSFGSPKETAQVGGRSI